MSHALNQERKGAGQTLLHSDYFPRGEDGPHEFSVRIWQDGCNSRLYNNVVHVYMAENAYVIIRSDKNVITFSMDKVRLEIN